MTTLRQLLDSSRTSLTPLYGDDEARWMLRIVMEHVKGWDQTELAIRANDEVSDFIVGRVGDAVRRLLAGEPIQYIYGDTYWYGMTLKVTPDVLIPRPETQELVDMIVKENPQPDLRVLDVCTENAALQKVKVSFREADALTLKADRDRYDIIVSNPPYVMDSEKARMDRNVLDHEPALALFVPDNDALKFYKAIAGFAADALSEQGKLYFELNPLTAGELKKWMDAEGWSDVQLLPDMYGKIRFMVARR